MNAQPYVDPPRLRDDYVLADAAVVDVETGEVTPHQDIRIRDGRIALISCHGTDHGDREVVEASGQFVVPAYVDAHAHPLNHPDEVDGAYALMLAAGVAGYRQMSSDDPLLRRRREGALREPVGAPALLALPGDVITPITAPNPEATAATVRRQKAAGADFVKAATASHDAFMATLRTAREVGLPRRRSPARQRRCGRGLGRGDALHRAPRRPVLDVRGDLDLRSRRGAGHVRPAAPAEHPARRAARDRRGHARAHAELRGEPRGPHPRENGRGLRRDGRDVRRGPRQ
ncbi:hypothetical protein [Brachybacterium huguangmaarense]